MVETAICKVFCSEMGWHVVNDAMQIIGGESYMTENEVERAFRDSRINLIVEGANRSNAYICVWVWSKTVGRTDDLRSTSVAMG